MIIMHYQYLHMYMRQCLKLEHYNVLLYCIKFSLLGKESSCKLLETRSLFFKICWPCHDICSYNIFGDWVVVKFDLLCYCINDNCLLSFDWHLIDNWMTIWWQLVDIWLTIDWQLIDNILIVNWQLMDIWFKMVDKIDKNWWKLMKIYNWWIGLQISCKLLFF